MKKIFTYFKKKYLFLLAFLVSTLLSIGASTWLVIRENEFKPGYVKLQTPINLVYTGDIPEIYEYQLNYFHKQEDNSLVEKEYPTNESVINDVLGGAENFTVSEQINGTLFCTNLDEIYYPANTDGTTKKIKATIEFRPSDSENYSTGECEVEIAINPVCYAKSSDNVDTYYGSLNSALEAETTNLIAIIPETNPIINRNVTIGSGQTVVVPYDNNWNNDLITNANGEEIVISAEKEGHYLKLQDDLGIYHQYSSNSSKDFADSGSKKVGDNRRTNITLNDNITINNQGNLSVLGEIGGYTEGLSCHTSGRYSQITLGASSKIINTGNLEVRGYIKDLAVDKVGEVINNSGGEMSLPFVIYDNQGARPTIGLYMNSSEFPFTGYNMPNIHSKITTHYGAILNGFVDLFTGSFSANAYIKQVEIKPQHNVNETKIVGSGTDALINLGSNSRLEIKYNPYEFGYTKNNWASGRGGNYSTLGITNLKVYGTASTGSINLIITLGNTYNPISVSSVNGYFGIPWLYDIEVMENATLNFNSKIKVMSGATLTVKRNAKLNVNSPSVVYSTFTDSVNGTKTPQPYIGNQIAKLIIAGGTMNVNAQFGGIVLTQNNGGSLALSTTSLSNNVKEGTGNFAIDTGEIIKDLGTAWKVLDYMDNDPSVKFDDIKGLLGKMCTSSFMTQAEAARGYIYNKGDKSTSYQNFAQASYTSYNGGWYTGKYTINVSFNSNGGSTVTTHTPELGHHEKMTISKDYLDQFVTNKDYYTFDEWVLSDGTSPIGKSFNSDVALKATWSVNDYTIKYDLSSKYKAGTDAIGEGTNNAANIEGFNYESGKLTFYSPTHSEEYFFDGWYLDDACTIRIPMTGIIESTELVKYLDNEGAVTLHALWYDKPTTITFVNDNEDYNSTFTSIDFTNVPTDEGEYSKYIFPDVSTRNGDDQYGKYFIGYYLDEEYTREITYLTVDGGLTQNEITSLLENRTLIVYVKWEDKVKVNYSSTTSNDVTAPSYEFIHSTQFADDNYSFPDMTGGNNETDQPEYFLGWTYEGNDGYVTKLSDITLGELMEITIVANWDQKVHITYSSNGENGISTPGDIYKHSSQLADYTLPDMTSGNATGQYYFHYWQYNGNDITGGKLTTSIVGNATEVTLVARWEQKITVNYIAKGDSNSSVPTSYEYVLASKLSSKTLTDYASTYNSDFDKEYYFVGWYSDESCSAYMDAGTELSNLTISNGVINVYHKWEKKIKVTINGIKSDSAQDATVTATGITGSWKYSTSKTSFYIKSGTAITIKGSKSYFRNVNVIGYSYTSTTKIASAFLSTSYTATFAAGVITYDGTITFS